MRHKGVDDRDGLPLWQSTRRVVQRFEPTEAAPAAFRRQPLEISRSCRWIDMAASAVA